VRGTRARQGVERARWRRRAAGNAPPRQAPLRGVFPPALGVPLKRGVPGKGGRRGGKPRRGEWRHEERPAPSVWTRGNRRSLFPPTRSAGLRAEVVRCLRVRLRSGRTPPRGVSRFSHVRACGFVSCTARAGGFSRRAACSLGPGDVVGLVQLARRHGACRGFFPARGVLSRSWGCCGSRSTRQAARRVPGVFPGARRALSVLGMLWVSFNSLGGTARAGGFSRRAACS